MATVPRASRGVCRLVASFVLAAGAMSSDAIATPDLTLQDPWTVLVRRDENGAAPETPPAGLEIPHSAFDLGDVPYDADGLEQSRAAMRAEDTAGATRPLVRVSYTPIEIVPQELLDRFFATPEGSTVRQMALQANAYL